MSPEAFDLRRLSARERAILEGAIEGLIDLQIALRLDISPSTVSSYWVRIRGKVGQISRTEMVALALKQRASDEMAAMLAKTRAFEAQIAAYVLQEQEVALAEAYRAALEAMPEAVLVCDQTGRVIFANARLASMFGFDARELADESIMTLLPPGQGAVERTIVGRYLDDPVPVRLGVDRAIYARRKDGRVFRAILLLDAAPAPSRTIVTCIVRDFEAEVGMRRDLALVHAGRWEADRKGPPTSHADPPSRR